MAIDTKALDEQRRQGPGRTPDPDRAAPDETPDRARARLPLYRFQLDKVRETALTVSPPSRPMQNAPPSFRPRRIRIGSHILRRCW